MAIDEDLLHAADLDFFRAQGLFLRGVPTGEVIDSRDLFIANTGAPFGEFNLAFLKPPLLALDEAIEKAEKFFGEKKFPFRFGVHAESRDEVGPRLLDAGYIEAPAHPTMVLPKIPDPPPPPAELEILEIDPGPRADEFRAVAERGFGFPTGMGQVAISDALIRHPDTTLYLGRVDGVPVATSLLQMSNRVAGIYFVACEADHRRKGYGEALTWAASVGGAVRGAAVASLQASEMGRPVYERMGFEHTGAYHWFATPEDQAPPVA